MNKHLRGVAWGVLCAALMFTCLFLFQEWRWFWGLGLFAAGANYAFELREYIRDLEAERTASSEVKP